MSFLGSTGTLMERSGMRTALEKLYTPVTMGHMMTGKAYLRALGILILSRDTFFQYLPYFPP